MPQVEVKTSSSTNYQQQIKAGTHTFNADAPKSAGGLEAAPDPHELLLGALGACTSMTMQMYAKRKGWDLKEVTVKVSEERTEQAPGQPISKISREIKVGGDLAPDQVESLKAVAEKCPIHKLLSAGNQITTAISHN
jgi:putative redox protein